MVRTGLFLLFLTAFALGRETNKQEKLPKIEGKAILAHIKVLADDKLKGRAAGSDGAQEAAAYAAAHFKRLGLKPMGDNGTYFQNFTLPRGFKVDPSTAVEASRGSKKVKLEYDKDLRPLSLSGPGDITGEAVFAGYGIAAPELDYDDYADIDAKGKIVIVLRHAPDYDGRKSPFSRPGNRRKYALFQSKVSTAVGAGAAALIVVNDPAQTRKPRDDKPMSNVGGAPSSIPVIHMTYKAGKKLARVLGFSLQKKQRRIDKNMAPDSFVVQGATVRVNAALTANRLAVRNVCALLEAPRAGKTKAGARKEGAQAPAARETLVVGAHFDHVGLGAYGSLAGKKGQGSIHNGADDNSSGTSSLLEIAVWMKARQSKLKRDVLFLLFTAEELGLLGSKHYVGSPVIPLEQCVAMVNLDMVGRLGRGRLQVGGVGTSPIFTKLIEGKNRPHKIRIKFNPGGRAPSDNTSFYEKGMPVLFFFTGLHKDYHRPSDDWKGIDKKGIGKVARLAADVSFDLATRETRPPFTRSDASGLDAGPFLGLSLEQKPDGVYVIHVEKKSPASRAKFKVGDKVEEFENRPVNSISAFNQIHSNTKPKQKVTIVIRRGPRLMKKTAILGGN